MVSRIYCLDRGQFFTVGPVSEITEGDRERGIPLVSESTKSKVVDVGELMMVKS